MIRQTRSSTATALPHGDAVDLGYHPRVLTFCTARRPTNPAMRPDLQRCAVAVLTSRSAVSVVGANLLTRRGAQVPYVHVHSGRLGRPATESSLSTGWPLRATWSRYNAIGRSGPSTRLQRCSVSWPRAGPGPLRRVGPGHESGPSPPTGCSGDPGRAPGGTAGACPRPARGWAPPHPANSGRRSRFPRQQSDPVVRAEQATLQHVLEPSVHVGMRQPRSACARLVMSRHLLG
jgi:hypothetical protein